MNASASRRAVLRGFLATTCVPARAGAVFDADVLVVGAGVAGLAAAGELRRLGKTTVVIEARDRIGGRVFTERGLGAPYEAGALYIHWAERNPLAALAATSGIPTQSDSAMRPTIRSFDEGLETTSTERARRSADFGRLGPMLDGDDIPDRSIADVAHDAIPSLDDAAASLSRLALGDESDRISARDYARLWSGDDLLLPGGYDVLVGALGQGADIKMSTVVKAIDWSGAGVEAQTDNGTVRARRAVVTVPVGVLQADAIRFEPALPATIRDALAGFGTGALSKIGMRFDFSMFDVARGDIFVRAPNRLFDFDCRPFDNDIVVAIFGGDFAREITRSADEAIAAALDSLVAAVGSKARRAFKTARLHAWHNDALSRGCYAHCLPGHADVRADLRAPVGDRIVFAGEATAPDGAAMTTGGAFLAGQAAARWAAG